VSFNCIIILMELSSKHSNGTTHAPAILDYNNGNKMKTHVKVVIIQQGAFLEDKATSSNDESISVSPLEVQVGLVPRHEIPHGQWRQHQVIPVNYHYGKNQEIYVDVSSEMIKDHFLGYFIKFYTLPKSRNENFTTENRFINLDHPEGHYVQLPLTNVAHYPWKDNQYQIVIHNLNNPKLHFDEKIQFNGKVTVVYFGFTSKSSSDYLNDRDLPWNNFLGEYKLEGSVNVYHVFQNQSQSGNNSSSSNSSDGPSAISNPNQMKNGMSIMNEIWVRVPLGKNLLWRIGYDRFDLVHGKSVFGGHFESETIFFTSPVPSS